MQTPFRPRCWLVYIALLLTLPPAFRPSAAAAEERILADARPRLVVAGQGYFPVARQLRDGRISVVLRGGASHIGIKGRLDMVFSDDDGKTFGKPVLVYDSPVDDRNPAFGQAADGDLVVAFWRAAKDTFKDYATDSPDQPVNTCITRSADGGKTWSKAAEIDVRDIGYGSPYGKILTLADGTMLMNIYGYGVRRPGERPEPKVDHSYLYRSADGGHSWQRHGTIGKGFNETALLELPGGRLLAAMRSAGDKANVWTTRSADGGKTWSAPEEVSGPSAHPADLATLPDGRVLMVTGFRAGPFGVRGVIGDTDGHFRWDDRFVLLNSSTNGDTGYPSSVVLKDGRVLTFYYAVGSKTHPDWGVHCGVVEYTPPAPVVTSSTKPATPTTRPAAAKGPAAPLCFLQFSDPQFGMFSNNRDFAQETANFEFAIATANRIKPAFIIVTGDLTNKAADAPQAAEYHRIAKKLDPAIHLYNVPGNHDVGNKPTAKSIAAYVEQFGPDHYRFREGDLIGLVLDSALISAPDAAMDQLREQDEWLKAELQKARQEGARHIIVFQHHPPFVKTADEPDAYFNLPLARRGAYLDLLHQFGVSHLFSGHLHQEKVARDGGLEVVVTGAIGKPLGGSRSGFRVVVVRDEHVEHHFYDLGDVPNRIDPATWPSGELLRGGQ